MNVTGGRGRDRMVFQDQFSLKLVGIGRGGGILIPVPGSENPKFQAEEGGVFLQSKNILQSAMTMGYFQQLVQRKGVNLRCSKRGS